MSRVLQHPIEFVLSDMDGTLLRPDHSFSPRTLEAVKALREAGIFFSLATGRPPWAMGALIQGLGIDIPTAAFNGGTLVNPDGSYLVAHYIPRVAAVTALELFARHAWAVESWVFADDQWLVLDGAGAMVPREQQALGTAPVVVESFEPWLERIDKIVAASGNSQLLIDLEAVLQPLVTGHALASRSQRAYLDVTALQANKGEALVTLANLLGVALERTAAIGDGGNDPAMFQRAGLSIAMGQAEEAVRRQADRVTASNLEDGAAQAIERYILPRSGRLNGSE